MKIWGQAASYRPHLGSPGVWLSAPVRNTCLDRLAADWLTGGLSPAAQRLLEQSPAFTSAVQHWRTPGGLMRRTAPPATGWGARAWQRLSLLLGGVAVAAVTFSVVLLVQRPNQPGSAIASVQMAALLHGKGGQSAVVTVHNGALTLTAVSAMSAPSGKSYQLWLLPAQGAPVSLGVVVAGQTRYAIPAAALAHLAQAKAFAVSVEPQGGSPTGLPTGTVIMVGTAQRA